MKRSILQQLSVVLLAQIAMTTPVRAQSNQSDLREACRKAVAGEYISAYDAVTTGRASIIQLEEMTNRVSSAHKIAESELKALRTKVDHVSYDMALSDELIHQTERVRALAATLALYKEQVSTARAKILVAENREKTLRKAMIPVFDVKRGYQQDKDFPVAITYKAPCPRFRFMCPLPISYHDALAAIPLKQESMQSCERYIGYSMGGMR